MEALSISGVMERQNDEIARTVRRERSRLLHFIQKRIPDRTEAEDVLQDVFYQLTEAYRTLNSIERVTAWLFTGQHAAFPETLRDPLPPQKAPDIV